MRTQLPGTQILDQGIDTVDIKDGAVTPVKLAISGITAGTYAGITFSDKGIATSSTALTTLAQYGITDATPFTLISDSTAPSGFVNRASTTIAFNNSTRQFSITPTNTNFIVYVKGVKYVKTAGNVTIGTNEGLWYIYYNTSGVLTTSQTAWDLYNTAPVATLYWDSANTVQIYFGDERHTTAMDVAMHDYLHNTQGAKYKDGLLASNYTTSGNGSSNSDYTLALGNGTILDEDITVHIAHSVTPVNLFEQILTPAITAPVLYRTGASSYRKTTASTVPFKMGARPQYNLNTSGTWSTVDTTNNSYITTWVVATNDVSTPVIFVMGQSNDNSSNAAKNNNTIANFDFSGFPSTEFKFLYRLIYHVSNSHSNSAKARLEDILDVRGSQVTLISSVATASHSILSDLSVDDHLQYLHLSNARNIVAQHTFAPVTAQAPFLLSSDAQGQLVPGLNAALLDGNASTAFQPASNNLTGINTVASNGLYVRTGTSTATSRTLTASSSKISISDGDGVSGNPTFDVSESNLTLSNLGGTLSVSKGGTGLTALGTANQVFGVNNAGSVGEYKTFTGTGITITHTANNIDFTTVNNGTVTFVALAGSTGLGVSGSPITSSGTITLTLGTELQALSGLASTGILARAGSGTYTPRTITGTAGNIVITNGNGVSGDPVVNLGTVTYGTGGTLQKFSTDTFGRVNNVSAVTTADITTLVDATYVNVTGDTMSGALNMGNQLITNVATPVSSTDAANKGYVDSAITGLSWKQAVRVATTAAGTLATSFANGQTVDGVTLVTGDRILIKNQSTASENGIYTVNASGAPTRGTDADSSTGLVNSAAFVDQGTVNADTGWVQTTNAPITVGSTGISYAQFSGSGAYIAGTGLALNGNTFSLAAVDSIDFLHEGPTNKTYVLKYKSSFVFTINSLNIVVSTGTCTAAIQINSTNVTGLSTVSVASTLNTATATAANTVAIGDTVSLVISSMVGVQNLQLSLVFTRT